MQMHNIPFGTTDWSTIEQTEHKGDTGMAYWRTRQFGDIRVRMVQYSAGYLADHWCSKGHRRLPLRLLQPRNPLILIFQLHRNARKNRQQPRINRGIPRLRPMVGAYADHPGHSA